MDQDEELKLITQDLLFVDAVVATVTYLEQKGVAPINWTMPFLELCAQKKITPGELLVSSLKNATDVVAKVTAERKIRAMAFFAIQIDEAVRRDTSVTELFKTEVKPLSWLYRGVRQTDPKRGKLDKMRFALAEFVVHSANAVKPIYDILLLEDQVPPPEVTRESAKSKLQSFFSQYPASDDPSAAIEAYLNNIKFPGSVKQEPIKDDETEDEIITNSATDFARDYEKVNLKTTLHGDVGAYLEKKEINWMLWAPVMAKVMSALKINTKESRDLQNCYDVKFSDKWDRVFGGMVSARFIAKRQGPTGGLANVLRALYATSKVDEQKGLLGEKYNAAVKMHQYVVDFVVDVSKGMPAELARIIDDIDSRKRTVENFESIDVAALVQQYFNDINRTTTPTEMVTQIARTIKAGYPMAPIQQPDPEPAPAVFNKVNFDAPAPQIAPAPFIGPAPAPASMVQFSAPIDRAIAAGPQPMRPASENEDLDWPAFRDNFIANYRGGSGDFATDYQIALKRAEEHWKKHPRGKARDMAHRSKRIAKDPHRFNPSRADWPGIDTP